MTTRQRYKTNLRGPNRERKPDPMNFEVLLKPYKKGGTQERPVTRTIDTIVDYFLNKKQYPMEIFGGAFFMVFNYLNSGGEFKGDGSYGSPGKELVTAIRIKCDDLMKHRIKSETFQAFLELYAEDLKIYVVPNWKRKFLKWWYGRDIFR